LHCIALHLFQFQEVLTDRTQQSHLIGGSNTSHSTNTNQPEELNN